MGPLATTASVAGGLAGAALFIWPLAIWLEVRKCEKPKYTVLKALTEKPRFHPPVEVRRYAPFLVAESVFENADMRSSLSNGFRQIAGFIFGKNIAADDHSHSQKVAMTSPVVMEKSGGKSEKVAMTSPVTAEMSPDRKQYKVSFIMPSKYTKETLPKPVDDRVVIKEVPAHTLASISWRGRSPRESLIEEKRQELISVLRANSIAVDEEAAVKVYQYYPPFAPAWMRLNEVLLPVDVPDESFSGQQLSASS